MRTSDVFAVNLRSLRDESGLTQERLASLVGYTREYLSAVENRRVAIPMRLAVNCARVFGKPVAVEQDGIRFVVMAEADLPKGGPDPDRIPDDEELHDLNDVEHNLNVLNQAADVVQVMQRLTSSPLLLRSDSELSDALRIAKYKELFELDWAVRGRIREGEQLHPHLVQEGLRRALAERPGAEGRESDEQVA